MNDFDQKRADRDTVLYNTDGRNYDLKMQEERLEIVARPTAFVLWGWTTVASVVVASLVMRFVPVGIIPMWQRYLLFGVASWASCEILERIVKRKGNFEPQRWTADKNTGQFCTDKREIAQLDDIVALCGWKKGRRFLLAVRLRDGREVRLGVWKFGGKEWAWRQDAAQIAQFLGVPLDIAPVIPA